VSEHEVDVVVIGLGPGGEYAAGRLAEAGLAVAGVEARLVGGECPYWGCIPSKMMIRAADLLAEGRRIPGLAGSSVVTPDWAPVAHRIRAEATDDWDDTVAADRFTGKGGRLFRGYGRITAPDRAGTPYWTNHEAIETGQLPESIVVLGGGAVGAELAQVFGRFGARVTIVEALGQLLPLEEPESGKLIAKVFGREGIGVHTGSPAERVSHDGDAFTVSLKGGQEVTGERLLVATGRRADLASLGAGTVGIDESGRQIPVDGHLRAAPGVWALGDVVGQGAFTHMSMYHAGIVVADILGEEHHPAEHHAVPRVTFTDPEVGAVGLTEAGAREQGITVRVGRSQVPSSARGWIHKAGNDGFIKLVQDAERGVLVGATSAGPAGGEVLSMLTLAVHAAVPAQRLGEMIYAYPTFHRAVEEAVHRLS